MDVRKHVPSNGDNGKGAGLCIHCETAVSDANKDHPCPARLNERAPWPGGFLGDSAAVGKAMREIMQREGRMTAGDAG